MKPESVNNLIDELYEEISKGRGCPLCSLMINYEFNLISQIQYNVTYNDEIRKQVALEGGFCDFHFRQFKKIANGKTNIILLKSIINEGVYRKNNFFVECRICKSVNNYENEILQTFLHYISNEENRKKFDLTNGVCNEHLNKIDKLLPDDNLKIWLHKVYIMQIERMQSEFEYMSQFKSFYEIDREKRVLINILIEKLVGRKTGTL